MFCVFGFFFGGFVCVCVYAGNVVLCLVVLCGGGELFLLCGLWFDVINLWHAV